ncbi:hypothetical protein W03_13530 [Nitrosomonas sp. PY1]|nr:hypothetical protein W03_13530 [Nitrosomonas sp. PY1]
MLIGVATSIFAAASHAEPPEAPKLYISTNGPQVSFYWDEVSKADNYILIASNLDDGSPFGQFDLGAGTRLNAPLPEGSGFFVSIRAENADGNSNFSIPHSLVVPSISTAAPSIEQVIQNYARNVILNTYSDLAEQTKILRAAIIELQFEKTDKNLYKAQNAWRNARLPWEQSEAFVFGPVDTNELDPALDSWPINATDIQNIVKSDTPLTTKAVSTFDPTLKGFHVIEYLLFGSNSNKAASELTDRELAYLIAAASVLSNDAQALVDAWNPNDGNYLSVFSQAGAGSTAYPSQTAALQEMLIGMIGIADEVANGKLGRPLTQQDANFIESRFSANSRSDFMNNIRGLLNVYTGNYMLSEGPGLDALVKSVNPALDEAIRDQIEKSIAAIYAIPQPFSESIINNRAQVQAAVDEVKALLSILIDKLLPLVPAV